MGGRSGFAVLISAAMTAAGKRSSNCQKGVRVAMDEEKISNMERQPVSEMPKLVLDESELAPAAEAKPEITPR